MAVCTGDGRFIRLSCPGFVAALKEHCLGRMVGAGTAYINILILFPAVALA
ncbi:hypothetical protein J6590_073100 [Homalodisca vitripennis]|nr:hypothetical protein J6590_073100 [Homalodisca vitripennis]